jgi:DNA-binding transcriptional MerR regulator
VGHPILKTRLTSSSLEALKCSVPESLTITQVAKLTHLSAYTLRYYEELGPIGPVTRAASGYRQYQQQDLDAIAFVKRLRVTGMPIADMKRMGELRAKGSRTAPERMQILADHRDTVRTQIRELEANLEAIEDKLSSHGWPKKVKEKRS